jgi:hypothetical protein
MLETLQNVAIGAVLVMLIAFSFILLCFLFVYIGAILWAAWVCLTEKREEPSLIRPELLQPIKTEPAFDSREHMLETLRWAYQNVLDESARRGQAQMGLEPTKEIRLTIAQQKELGRRLSRYWDIKK